ncbi:hypothetical protein Rhe02_31050 [Rhizocola hellebori]|uniref:Uncharacterized protein n=1 Tax=Rhizocola hellebori TaxID=1392758 RepID=A0A8J3VGM4_9ACTN|nr:hypothetical protein [Rhizocola hellebori]GIH05038.1 hypothetical protein Rhe02_31050 [Rhizocola hellebori]
MLDRVVAALAEVLVAIEMGSDDEIDPDFADAIQFEVVNRFDALSDEERLRLTEIFEGLAKAEPSDERRAVLSELPQAYGLLDEEHG